MSIILDNIFPSVSTLIKRRKINNRIKEIEKIKYIYKDTYDEQKIIKELENYLNQCREERNIIDDKAKSTLLILTVTLVFLTGVVTNKDKILSAGILGDTFLVLIVISILYFIFSVIHILECLNLSKYYSVTLNDKFIDTNNEFEYKEIESIQMIKNLYEYTKINQYENLNKKNALFASFTNIRNGVVIIGVIFIFNLVFYQRETTYVAVKAENYIVTKMVSDSVKIDTIKDKDIHNGVDSVNR